jgi:protein TonB
VSVASMPAARSRTFAMVALSVVLHGAAWAAVARARPAPARERIELEVVRRARPTAPAVAAPEEPQPPARRALAAARPLVPRTATPPPPPPLASAPGSAPESPPESGAPKPLPRVGISLGSTVASGGFAVGIGNTAYGRAGEPAAAPGSVQPYARGITPAARLSVQPRPLELPRIGYPPDARREGLEGRVVLVLRIDARGSVAAVRVVDAPSPSLAAAAAEGARRFRFTPGLAQGEPVETEIRFTYTFLLE